MCMVDDCEPWTVYHGETRRAAKEHRCDECCRVIERGESYRYASGLCDGYWSTMRTCEQCHAGPCAWLNEVCEGHLHEMVEEDLFEHITGHEAEYRSAPLIRLGRWMRADWRDRSGDLRPVDEVARLSAEAVAASTAAAERRLAA